MKKLFLIILFLSPLLRRGAGGEVHAQTAPGIEWQNTIGGSANDGLNSITQTPDGGYICGGGSNSNLSGDKTENSNGNYDYWILKLDSVGNIQWQNSIGGSSYDILASIKCTSDGGYICGGVSTSNISGDKTENAQGDRDYWVIKLDSIGNIQWQNTIGGSGHDNLTSVMQTSDGGYICGGWSNSDTSGDKTENRIGFSDDYWIVKLNSTGNITWQNTIGGTAGDLLENLNLTADGGFICAGYSLSDISGDKTENSNGASDYWIVKLDSTGNIQWQNTIGGSDAENLHNVKQTTDGGYICAGASISNISCDKTENSQGGWDFWIIKLNSTGNIQWQNTIGGNAEDRLFDITQTTDAGFICTGWTWSPISGDKTDNTNGIRDHWIIKLNSTGSIQWQNSIGGSGEEGFSSIDQTADGGYLIGGNSKSNASGDKTENSLGDNDLWIVKLYPDTTTGIANIQTSINNIQLFPNPAKEEITITLPLALVQGQAVLTVFDVMGNEVLEQPVTTLNHKLKTLNFAAGVYYVQVSNGNQTANARFVKM